MAVWYAGAYAPAYQTVIYMYVYVYSLHVSGSHVPIITRIIVSMQHLLYVTV